jgi:hypothetical protein
MNSVMLEIWLDFSSPRSHFTAYASSRDRCEWLCQGLVRLEESLIKEGVHWLINADEIEQVRLRPKNNVAAAACRTDMCSLAKLSLPGCRISLFVSLPPAFQLLLQLEERRLGSAGWEISLWV